MASESESDAAPEALSMSQSKAGAKEREAAIQRAEAARIRQRKEQNRKRDESLKKRAEETKKVAVHGTNKGYAKNAHRNGDEDEKRLQDRMTRAMQEAGEESDMSENEGGWTGLDGGDLENAESSSSESEPGPSNPRHKVKKHLAIDDDEDNSSGFDEDFLDCIEGENDSEDEDGEEEYEEELRRPQKKAKKSDPEPAETDYLPDHLFTSALSKPLAPSRGKETKLKHKSSTSIAKQKKSKRKGSSKDLIIGKKTIRTLPAKLVTPIMKAAARTVPPPKVRKFTDRSLSLQKSTKTRTLGWERRPVNIGSMRNSTLPATNFVRG